MKHGGKLTVELAILTQRGINKDIIYKQITITTKHVKMMLPNIN